ncbi:Peptidase M14 and/or Propep M14 domain containing protein [Asbolus verrucosus]|uniref:Zinc carboxypeptidase A 1 n=1 Tax=Asbolus verrucosus TaxID=1661398 RepID=A0A482VQQ7_ASBVE|nr:Peptidase M14 and/or Propep M14 domain containing protein [Asbolus verrucosus]
MKGNQSINLKTYLNYMFFSYTVYEVTAKNEATNEFLRHLQSNKEFDFWSKINKVGKPVSVMTSPKVQNEFEKYLSSHGIEYRVQIEDVQSTILSEKEYHRSRQALKHKKISFDQYLRHAEINAYLDQLAQDYPETVTVSPIGQSYENRSMNIIRISSSSGPSSKPVIFVEAGMHAREWISPALSLYIINQLVENPNNSRLLEDIDWIVLPSMNPDGYEYTWDVNRMWRKTRSPGVECDGVDGNRNFGFHWMEQGASDRECSDSYAGKEAFSEVEARNLRDILAATANISAFISLHSYGQYLFYPYSYDDVVPDNWQELRYLADLVKDVIFAINGTKYTTGSSTEVLYPAAGCSDDWAMGGAGIKIVYVFELPGGGEHGFDPPPSRILPVCAETWEGIKVIADYVAQNAKKIQ